MTQTTIYPSEKGMLVAGVFLASMLVLLSLFVLAIAQSKIAAVIILSMPLIFLAWLWAGTYYRIDDQYLYYKSGPFRGKIAIAAIREIVKNKTLWVGFRPALSQKGLIIRYDRWNEIYISPQHKEAFLKDILTRNEKISIKE